MPPRRPQPPSADEQLWRALDRGDVVGVENAVRSQARLACTNRLYLAKIQQRKAEAALLAANAQVEAAEAALVEIEETKADVNVPREEEESESVFPIELAAQHGNLEIVRTLTIAGANMPEYVFEDGHCDPSVTLMRCAGRARYLLQSLLLCAPLTLPLAPRPASDAVLPQARARQARRRCRG